MALFTERNREIERLSKQLGELVREEFDNIVIDTAEHIADQLIEEKGIDEVCRNIDKAIEDAEDQIDQMVDKLTTYTFDNHLTSLFAVPILRYFRNICCICSGGCHHGRPPPLTAVAHIIALRISERTGHD